MTPDDLQSVLKYVAAVLTAVLGGVALLVETRDSATRRVNRWGWLLFVGIVLSTGILIATQVAEDTARVRRDREAREQARLARETATILRREVVRANYPIQNVIANYGYRLYGSQPFLESYLKRVHRECVPWRHEKRTASRILVGQLRGWDRCYPTPEFEPLIANAMRRFDLSLLVYKRPISPAMYQRWAYWENTVRIPGPDLEMLFEHKIDPALKRDAAIPVSVRHDGKDGAIEVASTGRATMTRPRFSNGRVTSMVDLEGAQIFISVDVEPRWFEAQPHVTWITLDFGVAGVVKLEPLKSHTMENGEQILEYRFPAGFGELLESMRTYR